MTKIHIAIDTKQKGFDRILLDHALNGKEGWVFLHAHPKIVKMLEEIEGAGFGHIDFDLRDGLPENFRITKQYVL